MATKKAKSAKSAKRARGKSAAKKAVKSAKHTARTTNAVTAKTSNSKAASTRIAPTASASIAAATPGTVVRERVIGIFANVCGKNPWEVDGPKLSELTARCDVPFRAQIASAVNAEFNDLLQPYGSGNISCSATVSTLSLQITRDQA